MQHLKLFLIALLAGCVDLGIPQWSPDGRRVAFVHLDPDGTPELWFVDLDRTPVPKRLASGAFRPRWSTDGQRVFFLSTAGGQNRASLCSCKPDGSDVREHTTGLEGGIGWYEVKPTGRSVYYLREDSHELFEFDLATGRADKLLVARAAALDATGKLLAIAAEEPDGSLKIKLLELAERPKSAERVVGSIPVPDDTEGTRLWLLFSPGGKELVAFADLADGVHVLPIGRGRQRKLPGAAHGGAIAAGFSPDGRYLYLTTLADARPARFALRRIELSSGKSETIADASPSFLCGPSWTGTLDVAAELTPMGLRVWAADGRWERLYPISPEEYALAAEASLARGDPAEALEYIRRAAGDSAPGRSTDLGRLGLVESDAYAALGDRAEAARALLRAWLLCPVSDADPAEFERRAKALRGEDRLLAAIERAMKLPDAARSKALSEAVPLAAEPRMVAGLYFRIAESELRAGNPAEASKRFRLASEVADFPAADYAAALAALAQFVWGKNDRYAEELMLKAIDTFPASVLQNDLRAAAAEMQKAKGPLIKRTCETGSPSGAAAWVTARSVRNLEWAGRPVLLDSALERRRIVLKVETRYSLHAARPLERSKEILSDLPTEIGELAFSPDGSRLAFLAKGGVPGLEKPVWAAAYVVDLEGKLLVGDAEALSSGAVVGKGVLEDITWDELGRAVFVTARLDGGQPIQERIDIPPPRERSAQ